MSSRKLVVRARRVIAPARLIGRLYRSASMSARVMAIRSMLRPLSPLALAVVADGAFAFSLADGADDALSLGRIAATQVAELADFALQVDPGTLMQAAEALASPVVGTAFAAAALALLMRQLSALRGRFTPR